MADKTLWLLPEGIEELLPAEAGRVERLRRDLLDVFQTWGYELVMPPFVEFLDSLLTGTGSDLDLQTFKLTDQISGRTLGIRADMTPQVARIAAHRLKRSSPTRLCYIGTVLLARGQQIEKARSPMQVGAELYGHDGIESDVEIIRLMLEILAMAGVMDVHLDLGHVAIFRGLSRQAGLSDQQEAQLFEVLQRKAGDEVAELLDGFDLGDAWKTMFCGLLSLNGGVEVLQQARNVLSIADEGVQSALDDLSRMADMLQAQYPALPLYFDLAELRCYHYQTGVVFAAFVPGHGTEIARGGRYDDIGEVFGKGQPATGFSADLKVISSLSTLAMQQDQEIILAPEQSDPSLEAAIQNLRSEGRVVVRKLPGTPAPLHTAHLQPIDGQWRVVQPPETN